MKRVGWAILAVLLLIGSNPLSAYALDTMPSTGVPTKVNGPLLITSYSFSGHSLRYVQLYNSSAGVVSLAGWRISLEYAPAAQQIYLSLYGYMAPGSYSTVANETIVPNATFTFSDSIPTADPAPSSISLLPPASANFNNEVAVPTITSSTPRLAGSPATFFYARNVSSSTGNFLSTFTAFVPGDNYVLLSDALYNAPSTAPLRIIEVYPSATSCSPFETDLVCGDYVKLQNLSSEAIDLSVFRLRTGQYGTSSTSSNTVRLNGLLAAGHAVSFPISLSASGSWVWLEDAYGTTAYEPSLLEYPSSSGHDAEAWSVDDLGIWRWTAFPTPSDIPNTFAPVPAVNLCAGLVISEIAANVASEDQYIELQNRSEIPVDLTGCVLQTNRSTSKQYVFGAEAVAPGAYRSVYLKDTDLTLTKTTSGTVYLLSSDSMNEADAVTYQNLNEGTAWAALDGDWAQTYALTPDAQNILLEYPPCETGYIRNLDTGQCNKLSVTNDMMLDCGIGKERNPDTNRCRVVTASTGLVPCDAGQYRSPETNRCRSLATTTALLAPCAPNQERNPETNRCRAAETSTGLKPCAENQERNPDTNRCRNRTSAATTADFPVQAVAQSGEATLGWWAFSGAGTLAVGYAGWEWRREVRSVIKKASGFIAGRF